MKRKKNYDWLAPLGAALGVILIVSTIAIFLFWQNTPKVLKEEGMSSQANDYKVKLYFVSEDENAFLEREVYINFKDTWYEKTKLILNNMTAKNEEELTNTLWPFKLRVRSAYFLTPDMLILDLQEKIKYNQASSRLEWNIIRSITKTFVNNFEEIKKVKFLINGQEADTLCGHVDISNAFTLNDVE